MNELFQNVNGQLVPRDICARKHGGNEQSKGAFNAKYPFVPSQRSHVFGRIMLSGNLGRTVDELAQYLETTPNAISGRITELRIMGKIEKRGTRKTRSGCSAAVWVAI